MIGFQKVQTIKKMQILIHQSKIPTKIEVLYSTTPYQKEEQEFRKKGYFYLSSNEETNYQARELKTVYLDIDCQCLKLVLHKCYVNNSNLLNQVGIISLKFLGFLAQNSKGFSMLEYRGKYDNETIEMLKQLNEQKQISIQ